MADLAYTHPKVQRLRQLVGQRRARQEDRTFVAEGAKVVGEALGSGSGLESLFVDRPALRPAEEAVLERALAAGCPVFELAPGVLGRVAGTVSPQPVLAVVPFLDRSLGQLARDGVIVVCANLGEPGNLGTVLRSAEASGARGVICPDGTVDPYNPKCVRASAGALFHVPLVIGGNTVQVLDRLGDWGLRRLGTSSAAGDALWDTDLTGPVALVLGNEANGLPADVEAGLDGRVTIPMWGRAESLNVAMAATLFLYEAARQRRAADLVASERATP